jgi:hypothetical protein
MKLFENPVGADSYVRPVENKIQWSNKKQDCQIEHFIQLLEAGQTRGSVPTKTITCFRRGDPILTLKMHLMGWVACGRPATQHFLHQKTTKQIVSRFV